MATNITISFAKSKLVEMSLHSHAYWRVKKDEAGNREYLNFLLESAGKQFATDMPSKLETFYNQCHG